MDIKDKLPTHIAIIMDGNGRWAAEKHLSRISGHKAGIKSVTEVIETTLELKIPFLTLYAFSTENWIRPKQEINTLMNLLKTYLKKELPRLQKYNIRLNTIGDIEKLPKTVYQELIKVKELTSKNKNLVLTLALNYGGRSEIVNAVNKIIANRLKKIDEKEFVKYLYTADLPEPDLLIRTSGEMRVSNFLLWQIAYTELYITPVLWPDFRKEHFYQAIYEFQNRQRRFGDIKSR